MTDANTFDPHAEEQSAAEVIASTAAIMGLAAFIIFGLIGFLVGLVIGILF